MFNFQFRHSDNRLSRKTIYNSFYLLQWMQATCKYQKHAEFTKKIFACKSLKNKPFKSHSNFKGFFLKLQKVFKSK